MQFFRLRRIIFSSIILIITVILNYLAIVQGENPMLVLAITVIGLPVASMLLDMALGKRPGIITFVEELFSVPNYLQVLLKKVEASWLEQFLQPTLSRSTFFVPFTAFNPEDMSEKQLSINTDRLTEIISDENEDQALQGAVTNSLHQMLILGEQGVGKTIVMLKILRWAVQVCLEQNKWNSVPVVLNLSTWNVDKESFDLWVVNQLRVKYQLPAGIAKQAFDNKQLFLFLDGLDEVRAFEDYDGVEDTTPNKAQLDTDVGPESSHKLQKVDQVVKEFNGYMKNRVGLDVNRDKRIRFVMCCRTETYQALQEKPLAAGGIILHKLSREQVLHHVAKDRDNNNLRELMLEEKNKDIVEKARIPYWLNVMLKIFKDEDFAKSEILINCRNDNELFSNYVKTRLEKNAVRDFKSDDMVIYWLSNLAQYMELNRGEEFLIEELQPHRLLSGKWKRLYQFLFLSVAALFLFIVISLPSSMAFGYEWFYYFDAGTGFARGYEVLFYTTLGVLVAAPIIFGYGSMAQEEGKSRSIQSAGFFQSISETIRRSFRNGGWKFSISLALLIGMGRGLGRLYSVDMTPTGVLINFIVTFIAILFAFIWITGKELWYENINTVRLADAREWNSKRAINGFVAGLSVGLILLIMPGIYMTVSTNVEDIRLALARAVSIGSTLAICLTILFGLTGPSRRMKVNTRANEGIYQLFKNAFLSYTLLTIVGAIGLGLGYGLLLGRPDAEVNALLGTILGVLSLGFGLLSVFRHISLRVVLALQKRAPLNIAKFLDYTSQLTLTRKVGGRYLFEHSFLREYFLRINSELIESGRV